MESSFNDALTKLGDKFAAGPNEVNKKQYLAPFLEIAKLQSLFPKPTTYLSALTSVIERKSKQNVVNFSWLQRYAFETALDWMESLHEYPKEPHKRAIIDNIMGYIFHAWPEAKKEVLSQNFWDDLRTLRNFISTQNALKTMHVCGINAHHESAATPMVKSTTTPTVKSVTTPKVKSTTTPTVKSATTPKVKSTTTPKVKSTTTTPTVRVIKPLKYKKRSRSRSLSPPPDSSRRSRSRSPPSSRRSRSRSPPRSREQTPPLKRSASKASMKRARSPSYGPTGTLRNSPQTNYPTLIPIFLGPGGVPVPNERSIEINENERIIKRTDFKSLQAHLRYNTIYREIMKVSYDSDQQQAYFVALRKLKYFNNSAKAWKTVEKDTGNFLGTGDLIAVDTSEKWVGFKIEY